MSEALDELKAWADRLGRYLPGMGGPSTEDISRMSPEEYAQYQEDLAGAKTRAQPKMRRVVGNAAKSLYSVNPQTNEVEFFAKNPMHMERPEIADELLALPDWFQPLAEMLGHPYVPPEWAKEASEHTQQVQDFMQEGLDYPPASTKEEYALETLGSMLGQLPVPEGSFAKLKAPFRIAGEAAREKLGPVAGRVAQGATLVPRAGIEFFSPIVEPSLKNYAMGTGFGAGLQSVLRSPTQDEFESLKWRMQHGELDPDEAIRRLSDLITRTKPGELNLGTDDEDIGHAKGGRIKPPDLMSLRKSIEGMLKEAEQIQGSGKEMVPVEPQLPTTPDITPTLEDLKQMAGEAAPPQTAEPAQITDMPLSRRTFLRGATALVSPVKLNLSSLLDPSESSLGLDKLGETAMNEPPMKSWKLAPILNSINSALNDSDTAFIPDAIAKARTIPGGEELAKKLTSLSEFLDKEWPGSAKDFTDQQFNDFYEKSFGHTYHVGRELDNLARQHGVVINESMGEPIFDSPVDLMLDNPDFIDATKRGHAEHTKAAISWAHDPETYEVLTEPKNLDAILRGGKDIDEYEHILKPLREIHSQIGSEVMTNGQPLAITEAALNKELENLIKTHGLSRDVLENHMARWADNFEEPLGVISRVNDTEGYERAAWGATPSAARRALVDKLHRSGEFEDLDQIQGTLHEFGTTETKGHKSETVNDARDDPFEELMAAVRGSGMTADEDMPHSLKQELDSHDPTVGPHPLHDVRHIEKMIQRYANAADLDYDLAKQKMLAKAHQEAKDSLTYFKPDLSTTPAVEKTLEDIKGHGLLEDRLEYTADDLHKAYPDLSPGEILDLHDRIHSADWDTYQPIREGHVNEAYDRLAKMSTADLEKIEMVPEHIKATFPDLSDREVKMLLDKLWEEGLPE